MSPHFRVDELLPPGTRYEDLSEYLQGNGQMLCLYLEKLRELVNCGLLINTYHLGGSRLGAGYRDDKLNSKVGGVKNSLHKEFLAADIALADNEGVVDLPLIAHTAKEVGFTEVITYVNKGFCHVALEHLRR